MKLKEKFEELSEIPEAEEYFIMSQAQAFINFMATAINDLEDDEIVSKFEELQDMIASKRKAMAEVEV